MLRISEQDFYDQAEEHARLTRGTLVYLVSELEPLLQLDEAGYHPENLARPHDYVSPD